MARYVWNEGTPLGRRLREGLEELRSARHKLAATLGALNQMSDAQVTAAFGFSDGVNSAADAAAAAAKAELASDVAWLQPGGASGNALAQMLDQFA